jgi:nucleoside-diphosphate-sugar epimerase
MLKKILVTGGAGYIGSQLVRILLQGGYFVRTLDSLKFGGDALIDVFTNPNFEFIKGDICDEKDIRIALKDMDAVCHLAAIVSDPTCKAFPEEATRVNFEASKILHKIALEMQIKRFVFTSTCSNYGKMENPLMFLDESADLKPVSHYAETKVAFEKYLLTQTDANICTTILRFSTVYGASPRTRFDLTVNEFTRDVSVGKELLIYGEKFWRPYCHVFDLANAVALVLKSDEEKVKNEVFNVGNTMENYTKEMLTVEIKKVIPEMSVKFVQQIDDPRDYRVNCDKIRDKLGFKITKTVPDGIAEIHQLIQSGLISDSFSSKYKNLQ